MSSRSADSYLHTALAALTPGNECTAALDELPVPIYTTDLSGAVTYWNRACIDFAGRVPQLGEDRWCVTWHLYTLSGEPLAHDQCPMAHAVRERRPIRDAVAIAERPDGTRRAFTPYPTPLFDAEGNVTGAVNMLIDVTAEQEQSLTDQAKRCRRLANATYDRQTSFALGAMADDLERAAASLREGPASSRG